MSDDTDRLERRRLARGLKVFLDILFYLVLAVGVLLILSLPISAFSDYDEGWDANVPVAVGESAIFPQLRVAVGQTAWPRSENFRVTRARGELRFLHHSLPVHFAISGLFILFWGAFLWAVALLRRILATTAGGHPFDLLNVRRLNALGWIIVWASVVTSVLQYLASRWILSKIEVLTTPLSPPIQIHGEWILCGLLVLVLAAIWRQAVQMAEDQSLTV